MVSQTGNNRLEKNASRTFDVTFDYNYGAIDYVFEMGFSDDKGNQLTANFSLTVQ